MPNCLQLLFFTLTFAFLIGSCGGDSETQSDPKNDSNVTKPDDKNILDGVKEIYEVTEFFDILQKKSPNEEDAKVLAKFIIEADQETNFEAVGDDFTQILMQKLFEFFSLINIDNEVYPALYNLRLVEKQQNQLIGLGFDSNYYASIIRALYTSIPDKIEQEKLVFLQVYYKFDNSEINRGTLNASDVKSKFLDGSFSLARLFGPAYQLKTYPSEKIYGDSIARYLALTSNQFAILNNEIPDSFRAYFEAAVNLIKNSFDGDWKEYVLLPGRDKKTALDAAMSGGLYNDEASAKAALQID